MIIKSYDLDTPSIYVIHCNDIGLENFKEILWGIEEECIPYKVENSEIEISECLSHEASLKSKLVIGIGISSEKITLTTSKLDENSPLITIDINDDYDELRCLGSNGARLVKGIELKNLGG